MCRYACLVVAFSFCVVACSDDAATGAEPDGIAPIDTPGTGGGEIDSPDGTAPDGTDAPDATGSDATGDATDSPDGTDGTEDAGTDGTEDAGTDATEPVTGTVSGVASLWAPMAPDLPVTVTAFEDGVVGVPLGAGVTGPGGAFEVLIEPAAPEGQVLVTVNGSWSALHTLSGGSVSEATVSGLTSLAVILAARYTTQDDLPHADALALAILRLNDHLGRPDAVDSVSALPELGSLATPETLSALFHGGIAALAEQAGESEAALWAVLATDLSDGLFDGLADGELLSAEGGFVPQADTTRWDMAAATHLWLPEHLEIAFDLPGLAADGGYYHDISTDDGPLYPADSPPTPFDASAPILVFEAPTPDSMSAHNGPFPVAVSATSGLGVDTVVLLAPEGIEQVVVDGLLTATIDAASYPEGELTVTVQATDLSGVQTTIERVFLVDTTGPVVVFGYPTDGTVNNGKLVPVTGTVSDDPSGVSSLSLLLDDFNYQDPVPDAAGGFTSDLTITAGEHVLAAVATDGLGNVSTTSVGVIGNFGPTVAFAEPAEGALVGEPGLTVSGTATDSYGAPVLVTVTGGVGDVTADVAADGTWTTTLQLAAEGATELIAQGTDEYGAEGIIAKRTVVLDDSGPLIEITAPVDDQFVGLQPLAVEATVSDEPAGVSGVTVSLAGADANDMTSSGGVWTYEAEPFTVEDDGVTKSIVVEATDTVGNVVEATISVVVDGAPPVLTAVGELPAWVDTGVNVVVAADDGDGAGVTVVTVTRNGDKIFDAKPGPIEGQWSVPVPFVEGINTLDVVATDAVGNASPPLELVSGKDTTSPKLSVDPAAVTAVDFPTAHIVAGGTTDYDLTGTASDLHSGVAAVAVECSGVVTWAEVSPVGDDASEVTWLAALNDPEGIGSQCTVTVTDVVGNDASTTLSIVADVMPPEIVVGSPGSEWMAAGPFVIAGTVTDLVAVTDFSVSVGGADVPATLQADGSFSVDAVAAAVHGPLPVIVNATDAIGNVGAKNAVANVDAEPPSATSFEVSGAFTDSDGAAWTADETGTVTCEAEDGQVGVQAVCLSAAGLAEACGDASVSAEITIADTGTAVTCAMTDTFGNAGEVTTTFTLDVTPPEVALTSHPGAIWTSEPTVTIEGTAGDGGSGVATVDFKSDLGAVSGATLSPDGAWSITLAAAGSVAYDVIATDNVGNASTLKMVVVFDDKPPTLTLADSQYLDEQAADVTLEGGIPVYSGGTPITIGPACGNGCVVRKFPTRANMASFDDVAKNNLPVFNVVPDDASSPNSMIVVEYRFARGGLPLTDWRPATDNADGVADGIYSIVWAIENFTDGDPAELALDHTNAPNRVEVRLTDPAGNEAIVVKPFSSKLTPPPLFMSVVGDAAPDGSDLDTFTLDAGNFNELQQFTSAVYTGAKGPRLLVVDVVNPYGQPLLLSVGDTGAVILKAQVWRPYLAKPATALCTHPKGCAAGQCTYDWSGAPDNCLPQQQAKTTPAIAPESAPTGTTVTDLAGVKLTPVVGAFHEIAPGATIRIHLRGKFSGKFCPLKAQQAVSMVLPPGPPFFIIGQTGTASIYHWDTATDCKTGAADAESACSVGFNCAFTRFHHRQVVREVTVTSAPDDPPVTIHAAISGDIGVFRASPLASGFTYTTTSAQGKALPSIPYVAK